VHQGEGKKVASEKNIPSDGVSSSRACNKLSNKKRMSGKGGLKRTIKRSVKRGPEECTSETWKKGIKHTKGKLRSSFIQGETTELKERYSKERRRISRLPGFGIERGH